MYDFLYCIIGICECDLDFGVGDCFINFNDLFFVFVINCEIGGLFDCNFCNEVIIFGDFFLNRLDLMCKL